MRSVFLAMVLVACAHTGSVHGPEASILFENQGLDVAAVYEGNGAAGTRVGPREVVCFPVDRAREATVIRVKRGNEEASYVVNTVAKPGWYIVLPPHLGTPEFSIDVDPCI